MVLTGSLVNFGAVILGSILGFFLKKGLSKRIADAVMIGLGLCVLFVGISGSLVKGTNTLVVILSIVIGTIIGEAIDIDKWLNILANKIEKRFKKNDNDSGLVVGFVNSTMLFCVGAMTIVGPIQSGLNLDHTTQITKALIDSVAAIIMAAMFDWVGVMLSSIPILLIQGSISLTAGFVSSIISDYMINEITCIGSLLIVGIALNMLKVTKIKVSNMVPAVFMPLILCLFIK